RYETDRGSMVQWDCHRHDCAFCRANRMLDDVEHARNRFLQARDPDPGQAVHPDAAPMNYLDGRRVVDRLRPLYVGWISWEEWPAVSRAIRRVPLGPNDSAAGHGRLRARVAKRVFVVAEVPFPTSRPATPGEALRECLAAVQQRDA